MSALTRRWRHTLRLKDLLGEEDDSEATAEAAKGMHERLEAFRLRYYQGDDEIAEISDEFHTIAFIDGPAGVADVDHFNTVMNGLYDWADTGRKLWVE